MQEDEDGDEDLVWNLACPVAGHTKCNWSQEGFENDCLCGANARVSAQVRTIIHTCTGICICTKSDHYPYFAWNPDCPVLGHSHVVNSVAFSPDGNRVVSGSDDTSVKIWDVATGALVSSFVVLRGVW